MKIKQTTLAFAVLTISFGLFFGNTAYAAECGGTQTSIINCEQTGEEGSGYCAKNPDGKRFISKAQMDSGQKCDDGSTPVPASNNNGLWGLLLLVINIMTAGVGVLAVGGVIYGSILYTTATDSVEQKKQGKMTIINVVIGIVAYALMYSFLNFLIPGGLFSAN